MEEQLNLTAIAGLYGSTFFYTAEDYPESLQTDDEGAIVWRAKPNGKLTMLIAAGEYTDKTLTELLKNIVAALEIPFEAVSFGVVVRKFSPKALEALPTPLAIIFGYEHCAYDNPNQVYTTNSGAEVYTTPSLKDMAIDRENKKIAWETMKRFKDRI